METSLVVVIGMDPHKRSVTVEVMTGDETMIGHGRFATDAPGYGRLVSFAGQWPHHPWAVEGCEGIGRHVAQRLLTDGAGSGRNTSPRSANFTSCCWN